MAKFVDRFAREWILELDVTEMKRIRSELEINLLDAFAGDFEVWEAVMENPVTLVAIAYVLCREQIEQRGLSSEQFGKGMAGDALQRLGEAFTEALIDFFPHARTREMVRAIVNQGREILAIRQTLLTRATNALDVASLAEMPSAGSTSAPESSASPPAPSPSARSC